MATTTNHHCPSGSKRFGVFGGVFTPNVLTILGDTSNAIIKNNQIENSWQPKFFPK